MSYTFYPKLAKIINSKQSKSVVLTGNIHDLFWTESGYVPLNEYLLIKLKTPGAIQLVYELNSPIRINGTEEEQQATKQKLMDVWLQYNCGKGYLEALQEKLQADYRGQPSNRFIDIFEKAWSESRTDSRVAIKLLRQLSIASRKLLKESLHIFIEGADMLFPAGNGDVATLNDAQLSRISEMQDWFSDPAFVNGKDAAILIAESKSLLHPRISRLPQVIAIEVPSPDGDERKKFIEHFVSVNKFTVPVWHVGDAETGIRALNKATAGLSLYALRQLLLGAFYSQTPLDTASVIDKVEDFIKSQLGDDVVEFKCPTHKLSDLRGASGLRKFLESELIPGLQSGAYGGCAVSGPNGSGKTYIMEAVAAALGRLVLVLKNLRSKWFGETDVILERLERLLIALDELAIFIDEADTQFGGLGADTHETERRLTGKIQSMMSDPRLKEKVCWILMTARIHRLSPDIRRPGRPGDLIIPVLDPVAADRIDFIQWTLEPVRDILSTYFDEAVASFDKNLPKDYSAASFGLMRSHLKFHKEQVNKTNPLESIKVIADDLLPSDIGEAREYQTLQALLNCTRRSLLPPEYRELFIPEVRKAWRKRIKELEELGVN